MMLHLELYIAEYSFHIGLHLFSGVGPATLSVFGEPSRTNNFQESYHMELKRLMGIHPAVWQFTGEFN